MRHAEKDAAGDPQDPVLSEAGRERARALSRLLARAGVTHVFASEFRRTRETLAPLAEAQGLKVEFVPASELSRLADRIRGLPARSVAVVAGHSNTIPALAEALGGTIGDLVSAPEAPRDPSGASTPVPPSPPVRPKPGVLRDDEYSRIFVLTLRAARPGERTAKSEASVLELAYGA